MKVAIIGSLANDKAEMNSNWAGDGRAQDPISVVEAFKAKFPNKKLR